MMRTRFSSFQNMVWTGMLRFNIKDRCTSLLLVTILRVRPTACARHLGGRRLLRVDLELCLSLRRLYVYDCLLLEAHRLDWLSNAPRGRQKRAAQDTGNRSSKEQFQTAGSSRLRSGGLRLGAEEKPLQSFDRYNTKDWWSPRTGLTRSLIFLSVLAILAVLVIYASRPLPSKDSFHAHFSPLPKGCQETVRRQQEALLAAFETSLEGHQHVALLGHPDHENKGDAAIWLGEKILLAALGMVTIYETTWKRYREEDLRSAFEQYPDLIILLHGGGNFGDLYMWELKPRLTIVEAFPEIPIRFFPQSVHFESDTNAGLVASILAAHNDIELFVRDKPSEDFARKRFQPLGIDVRYSPDAAFMIGFRPHLNSEISSNADILLFHRKDTEGEGWPDSLIWPTNVTVIQEDWFDRKYRVRQKDDYSLDGLAYERFKHGAEFLRQGRVVILDRLHGHILGILLGIPHIIVDNRIGKLSAYYHSWTSECQLARLATSPTEAQELALKYLEDIVAVR